MFLHKFFPKLFKILGEARIFASSSKDFQANVKVKVFNRFVVRLALLKYIHRELNTRSGMHMSMKAW